MNMHDKILEIIVYMVAQLKVKDNLTEQNLSELHNKGYTKSEISAAFSWIIDRIEFADDLFDETFLEGSDSFRILHKVEGDLFHKDAWGELIQMQTLGIISNQQIDLLIERSLMVGISKMDAPTMKSLLSDMLFSHNIPVSAGNRIFLQGNDTIH